MHGQSITPEAKGIVTPTSDDIQTKYDGILRIPASVSHPVVSWYGHVPSTLALQISDLHGFRANPVPSYSSYLYLLSETRCSLGEREREAREKRERNERTTRTIGNKPLNAVALLSRNSVQRSSEINHLAKKGWSDAEGTDTKGRVSPGINFILPREERLI